MKTLRWALVASVAALLFSGPIEPSADAASRLLNRSIYIPVAFRVCPHLKNAVLTVDNQVVATLPSDRIFQFTYYPELKRIAPDAIQLVVRGDRADESEPFIGRIALTPDGIHTAVEHIPIQLSKDLEKLRYKLDVHADKVFLRIKCRSDCALKETTAPAATPAPASTTGQLEHR